MKIKIIEVKELEFNPSFAVFYYYNSTVKGEPIIQATFKYKNEADNYIKYYNIAKENLFIAEIAK